MEPRVLLLVAGLALVAGKAPVAFDPPFTFPQLKAHMTAGTQPTEANFTRACFAYVYGLLKSGGSHPLEKRPSAIPAAMMPNCVQADKKGCERFAEQLQNIVVNKMKEGPVGHMRGARKQHLKKGEEHTKVEEKAAVAPVSAGATAPTVKATALPHAAKKHHHWHKPGARVKQEELNDDDDESFLQIDAESAPAAFTQDFENFGLDSDAQAAKPKAAAMLEAEPSAFAQDFALFDSELAGAAPAPKPLDAKVEVAPKKMGLIAAAQDEQRHPLRFNDWCTNLYAVATSTYRPEAKALEVKKAHEIVKAKAAVQQNSTKVAKENSTKVANENSTNVALKKENTTKAVENTTKVNTTKAVEKKVPVVPKKKA